MDGLTAEEQRIFIKFVLKVGIYVVVIIAVLWYKQHHAKRRERDAADLQRELQMVEKSRDVLELRRNMANDLQKPLEPGKHPRSKVLYSRQKQESWEAYKERVVESLRNAGFPVK